MKKVSIVSLVTIMMIVISSCGSSNNVVNNHGITKRKYNRGFFVQRNSNMRTANNEVKEERANADKTLAKQEKVDAKRAHKESLQQKMNVEQTVAAENAITYSTVYAAEVEQRGSIAADERSSDGVGNSEQETSASVSHETMDRQPISNRSESIKKQLKSAAGGGSGVHIIILVILALLIPPLAVFLFEGVTTRFWIDLILALLGYGLGFGLLGGVYGLLGLIAVIYALLIVLSVI